MACFAAIALLLLPLDSALSSPAQEPLDIPPKQSQNTRFYDVQAHRGGRGNTVESTLPSFAWGLIDGATTLELDNGITQDGQVVVWHDENITPEKCLDTSPAFLDDPAFPYVGKYIANLTLAQLKTLDCGSKRQGNYPMQLTYPGARISTLQEVFDFVECADPSHQTLWNIESKIDARHPNRTKGVHDFVRKQHEIFVASPYYGSITYQSFDWRTIVAMKALDPTITISALIDDETATNPDNSTSPWLAGLRLDDFPGPTIEAQIAQAARAINADILSPSAPAYLTSSADPAMEGYIQFTTPEMIDEAHRLGLKVKPWTVNRLNIVEQLAQWGADGIITDYPNVVRRWAKQQGLSVAPKYPKQRVLSCLEKHMQ
ncbi:PLC-like phosphodiesterase [Leucogyrophana mollusca]|uniref:PLC-like phosphodiesterase n=1 Tax=Leucogyrophana mollusca TaxID=85980 RepID=A0ACB8BF93_9AGAM|nr:PLC-like phosphodiesterase [Leucogyrophana mollusca]